MQKISEGKDTPSRSLELYPFKDPWHGQQFPLYRYTGPAKLLSDNQHESLALPSIFEWKDDCTQEERPDARLRELPKDFEEDIILAHPHKFVNSGGPEKCLKGSIGYDQQDSNEDPVSPVRIVHQVETQQDAFVDGTAVVTLSYSVANRRA